MCNGGRVPHRWLLSRRGVSQGARICLLESRTAWAAHTTDCLPEHSVFWNREHFSQFPQFPQSPQFHEIVEIVDFPLTIVIVASEWRPNSKIPWVKVFYFLVFSRDVWAPDSTTIVSFGQKLEENNAIFHNFHNFAIVEIVEIVETVEIVEIVESIIRKNV